jgi:hypothetical protein
VFVVAPPKLPPGHLRQLCHRKPGVVDSGEQPAWSQQYAPEVQRGQRLTQRPQQVAAGHDIELQWGKAVPPRRRPEALGDWLSQRTGQIEHALGEVDAGHPVAELGEQ